MPNCLFLASFPLVRPKHGGQVRGATLMQAARKAGWQVDSLGIFPAAFFAPEEWGPNDIVIESSVMVSRATSDMPFADFHVARAAARDPIAVDALRVAINRLAPDVIHVEQPWVWLVLREALPSSHRIKVIYSSQNVEWSARLPLFRLGMKNPTSEHMMEATRLLEEEFARTADLVFSISDLEAGEIERISGRAVIYLPAVAQMGWNDTTPPAPRYGGEARSARCRYAALMGSAYWPNLEGFFTLFPEGLGFLAQGEQIWLAGALGDAVRRDARYFDFQSINDSRSRVVGYVEDAYKEDFFSAAACVIVPVTIGAGAKLKTSDAIASGRPVIATPHALEGYGPMVAAAGGRGIYVAATPAEFRAAIRQALREGLPGCTQEVRAMLSLDAMAETWSQHAGRLLQAA